MRGHKLQTCAIAVGSLSHGVRLVGPFDSRQAAASYADGEYDIGSWEIIDICPIEHEEWLQEP